MIISTGEYYSSSSSSSSFPHEEKSNWDMLLSGPNVTSTSMPYDGAIFVNAIRAMVREIKFFLKIIKKFKVSNIGLVRSSSNIG